MPTARVWQRHGRLRIYISAGGAELGWCDPESGRFKLNDPALAGEFWSAVRTECRRLLEEGRLTSASIPAAAAQPAGPDLASNVPGAAARARAKELRARHPFAVTAAKALGIRTEAEDFAMGAKGERDVGRKLNRWATRNGWHVLHAVPVSRSGTDIDHVIVASFGAVTVNTKTTKARVWVGEYGMTVGGKTVDYLRKSRAEAQRAARLLSRATRIEVPVQPAIVFTGARRFSVHRGGPRDVAVLPSPRALHAWLRKQPAVLADADVNAVYQAARDPGTWQSPNRG